MLLLPTNLLRFFEKEEYAHQFIQGQIRFGLLYRYQKIEGARQDKTEGKVSLYYPGEACKVHYAIDSQHPYYILCPSHPDVDVAALASIFEAPFLVRITGP